MSEEVGRGLSGWINTELVKAALKKFKAKQSPGPDGLRPVIFPYLPPNVIKVLTFLYQACVVLHYTPIKWRESKVIFIPKPGKNAYDNPKAYRPISLSNYLLKGLERLAVWHWI